MKQHPGHIEIEEYNYSLTEEKIAKYPLEKRDASNLLLYKNGEVSKEQFSQIYQFLPENSLLIFNETKVVQARLRFQKETGAKIEIFVLEPIDMEIQQAFLQKGIASWKCFIGNAKKWKHGMLQLSVESHPDIKIFADRAGESGNSSMVKFSWEPQDLSFAEILNLAGIIPLPPYLNREAEKEDKDRYQTIYAQYDGSVAAPTAGLHFTPEVFEKLTSKNIQQHKVTLHVGAGTFKPVSSTRIADHEMHTEKIIILKETIDAILNKNANKIISVGTTTVRTLESLYWYGVRLILDGNHAFSIKQWDPYTSKYKDAEISPESALTEVLSYMNRNNLDVIHGETQLMIAPGYDYKITDILITNFHQPKSTLLLLVSAFIGPIWEKVYDFALNNDFRFLSYGDSCLFFKK